MTEGNLFQAQVRSSQTKVAATGENTKAGLSCVLELQTLVVLLVKLWNIQNRWLHQDERKLLSFAKNWRRSWPSDLTLQGTMK